MPDTFDPEKRSAIMRRVRGKDTTPELKVRRALHAAGFRYRLHRKDLPGKPDVVLPRYHMVVLVHGCQWHWHGCKRSRMPVANREYWQAKIDRNVQRDKANLALLEAAGWRVRIIWECELKESLRGLLDELAGDRRARTSIAGSPE